MLQTEDKMTLPRVRVSARIKDLNIPSHSKIEVIYTFSAGGSG